MEFHRSTFEQYDPSYIICDCGGKIGWHDNYCKHCGREIFTMKEEEMRIEKDD